MKKACFIPIKSNSERVPGKNFRILCDKPLYQYIIENAIAAGCFDDIYVDTNSAEVKAFCEKNNVKVIERKEELARNTANGNDLLNYHYDLHPEYDLYFQLFATRIQATQKLLPYISTFVLLYIRFLRVSK